MSRQKRLWRSSWLLLINIALFGVLLSWGSLQTFSAGGGENSILEVPDRSLVVEAKTTQVKVLRQSANLSLDALGQVRFGPSRLGVPAELELEVTGRLTVTLMNSPLEVLSGAAVQYELPALGLQGILMESSPGRYTGEVTRKIRFSSRRPLVEAGSDIAAWRARPLRSYLNNRTVSTFGFLDYRANTIFSEGQPRAAYDFPVDLRLRGRVATDAGKAVARRALEGILEFPDQGRSETVQLQIEEQGVVEYQRQEVVRLMVEGGRLKKLSSPVRFDPPAASLVVVTADGVSRQYGLPFKVWSASSPVVLFWWGGKPAREPPTKLEKMTHGKPIHPGNEAGLDPVDLTTGNAYTTFLDLALPGRGLGVAFERTYNSRDDTPGPVGFGWSHSYNARLVEQEDGSVVEVDEDGTWRFYEPGDNGSFIAPPGSYSTLTRQTDGTYRLRRKGGVVLVFRGDGRLGFLEDPNGNRIVLIYNAAGLLTSVADSSGRQVQLFYDSAGHLIRLQDPAGREVRYGYRGSDLVSSVDPEGKETQYEYDEVHQLVKIIDPNGHERGFVYDEENRVRAFSFEENQHRVVLSYDPAHSTTFVTDARASRTEHRYEEAGGIRLVAERTASLGGVERTTWDGQLNRTSVTDALGRVTRFAYDGKGNLIQVTDPAGTATTFTYEPAFDRLTRVTDALGNTTAYTYDDKGNLIQVIDPAGSAASFTYDSRGQLLAVTDPLGRVTTYSYDSQGNLSELETPDSQSTRFAYDATGNVTNVTDPLGRVTQFSYDRKNRLTRIIASEGSVTDFTYDAVGNRTRVTDPAGLRTDYAYDVADRLVSVTDPAGQTVRYQYDGEGNLTHVLDGEGRLTRYAYDALGRLVQVRNALDQVTRSEYDPAGNRTQESKPDGAILQYAYDALNRLTAVTSLRAPEGDEARTALASFTYDPLGRRTSMTDASDTTTYAYDALNRLTRVERRELSPQGLPAVGSVAGTVPDVITYEYDAVGNRIRMEVSSSGSSVPDTVLNYTYDPLNRLTAVTSLRPVASSSLRGGAAPEAISFSYTYDPAGNVTSLSLPNGLTTSYAYDPLNRLTRLRTQGLSPQGTVPVLDLTYTYDSSGRRTQAEGTVPGSSGTVPVSVTYTYDPASRLTGETRTGSQPYAITYAYDKAGNRIEKRRLSPAGTVPEETTLWTVNPANQLLTIRGASVPSTVNVPVTGTTDDPNARVQVNGRTATLNRTTLQWQATVPLPEGDQTVTVEARDSLENLRTAAIPVTVIDPTKRSFTYDANGNLTEEQGTGSDPELAEGEVPVPGFTRTLYAYDPLNRLTAVTSLRARQSSLADEAISSYTYDGEGKRITSTEGGVTTTYAYDGLLPILERKGGATTAVNVWGLSLGGGIGGLLARVQPQVSGSSRVLYPLYDASGNVLAWTDTSGAVVSTTSYTAFGEVVSSSLRSASGGEAISFGFSTKPFSSATGLSYFGARYYSPSLSRWLTPDPLGQLDGPNVYSYVRNSPVNFLDPFGLSTEPSLIDETDVLIDVGSIAIGVVLPFVDGPLPIGDVAGAGLVAKGSSGLAGKTVIGHFPDYVELAEKLGAKRFQVPPQIWERLSPAKRWAANQKFLDRAIARGDEIILSNRNIRPGSSLQREVDYLLKRGYELIRDAGRLVKRR